MVNLLPKKRKLLQTSVSNLLMTYNKINMNKYIDILDLNQKKKFIYLNLGFYNIRF